MSTDRGRRGRGYTLITPANHYPSRLPEYGAAPVVQLVTPRLAPSRIGEYLLTLPEGAAAQVAPGYETFVYGLEGDALVDGAPVPAGGFAYLPPADAWELRTVTPARVLVIKRRYEGHAPPDARHGHRDDEPFADTPVPGFRRRELLPVDDPAFDFAMSLLAFDPGVGLANIEIHDEEHGLYMTAGGGDYVLDRETHPVLAGDFIYMAPYCPQGFTAGPEGAEYLLYKDTWRDGFEPLT
jgi:(S)-ureidoglycine aminohydrolase